MSSTRKQLKKQVKNPSHYIGDGKVECKRAMCSMLVGYKRNKKLDHETVYWLTTAFKYIWRAPLKNKKQDVEKAIESLYNALEAWK